MGEVWPPLDYGNQKNRENEPERSFLNKMMLDNFHKHPHDPQPSLTYKDPVMCLLVTFRSLQLLADSPVYQLLVSLSTSVKQTKLKRTA